MVAFGNNLSHFNNVRNIGFVPLDCSQAEPSDQENCLPTLQCSLLLIVLRTQDTETELVEGEVQSDLYARTRSN